MLGIGISCTAIKCIDPNQVLLISLQNVLFVSLLFLGLTVYLCLRSNRFINPFREHIGSGDMIFLIAIVPLASTSNFIPIIIIGLALVAIIWSVVSRFSKSSVPAAGLLAFYVLTLIITDFHRVDISLYDELLVASLLNGW